ncbi:hypothetical protein J7K93_02425 [bacterium]|nr:hypothetical protein [bacterium]
MKEKVKEVQKNLLDMVPVRTCEWDTDEGGIIYLLVPRFRNRFMKWIADRLGKSEFVKVFFDEKGSPAWKLADGNLSIIDIGKRIPKDPDETDQQMYERLAEFFVILRKNRFVELKEKR